MASLDGLVSRSPQNAAASRQRWGSPASERAQVNGNREAQVRTSGKNCCSRPRRARVALMNRRHLSRRILVWAVQRGHRMSSSGMTAAYVRVSNVCPRSTRICAVVAAHKSGRQLLGRPFMWAGLTLVRSQESRALRALVQTTSMLRSNASARKIDAHYVRSGAARGCLQRH